MPDPTLLGFEERKYLLTLGALDLVQSFSSRPSPPRWSHTPLPVSHREYGWDTLPQGPDVQEFLVLVGTSRSTENRVFLTLGLTV